MAKIKRIGVIFFGRLLAIIGGVIGLVLGILYSFGGLLIDTLVTLGWIVSNETPGLSYGTILAFGALLGMPFLFILCGFVAGILGAIIYNVAARFFGGIEADFK